MEEGIKKQSKLDSRNNLCTESEMKRAVFPRERQPSERWIREMRRRKSIPYVKISGMVFYDVDQVRAAIAKKFTVRSR